MGTISSISDIVDVVYLTEAHNATEQSLRDGGSHSGRW